MDRVLVGQSGVPLHQPLGCRHDRRAGVAHGGDEQRTHLSGGPFVAGSAEGTDVEQQLAGCGERTGSEAERHLLTGHRAGLRFDGGERAVEVALLAPAADQPGTGRVDEAAEAGEPPGSDLVVGVEHHAPVAVGPADPGGQRRGGARRFLAHDADPAVGHRACGGDGVVDRAVVDDHDLDVAEGLRQDTRGRTADHVGTITNRNHHAEPRAHAHQC